MTASTAQRIKTCYIPRTTPVAAAWGHLATVAEPDGKVLALIQDR